MFPLLRWALVLALRDAAGKGYRCWPRRPGSPCWVISSLPTTRSSPPGLFALYLTLEEAGDSGQGSVCCGSARARGGADRFGVAAIQSCRSSIHPVLTAAQGLPRVRGLDLVRNPVEHVPSSSSRVRGRRGLTGAQTRSSCTRRPRPARGGARRAGTDGAEADGSPSGPAASGSSSC